MNIKIVIVKLWENTGLREKLIKLKRNLSAHTFKKDVLVEQNQIIFGNTFKPYLSKKNTSGPSKVIVTENSKLITKQNEVSEIFNSFFYKCS